MRCQTGTAMPRSRTSTAVLAVRAAGRVDERLSRLDAGAIDPYAVPDTKPQWRGRLHSWAFFASLPLGVTLVGLIARTPLGRVGAAIFALSLTGLYAASAAHHRYLGTARGRPWMRWLDHAMIFVLIAGTYTPLCLLDLPRRFGIAVLVGAWSVAIAGIVMKFTRLKRFRRTSGCM